MMRMLVINGPNLDLLGRREPEVYGSETLSELETAVTKWATTMDVEATCAQSNHEGEIIELIHTFEGDGVVINPGAFTHTSHAIADAIRGVDTPVVEVHISNVREREPWRSSSVIAPACVRTIYGRGVIGYRNAIRHLVNRLAMPFETLPYGPHGDNVGDLRRGDGADTLIVLAHGGLWQHRFERDTVESLAVDLTRRGYHTFNVEYRRLGDGGGWPGSGHDMLTALEHLPQIEVEHDRVIAVSHSAGGQLVTWSADRASTHVDFHVAMSPLLDLEAAVANDDVGAAECQRLIDGGAPTLVVPSRVKMAIVHAASDQIVPVERSRVFSEEMGVQLIVRDGDHFALLDPTKPHWASVLELIGETT